MSDEITHNTLTGLNLYACRFQPNGDVFLTSGASDEVWGTSSRDADNYGVNLVEDKTGSGESKHYKADFDTSGNITGAAAYPVTVYRRLTGTRIDSDPAIAQGVIDWDGIKEITLGAINADQLSLLNIYDDRGDAITPGGTYPVVETDAGGVSP